MPLNARYALVIGLFLALASTPLTAKAQGSNPQPGDACSVEGSTTISGGVEIPGGHFMVCDGGVWISYLDFSDAGRSLLQIDHDPGACIGAKQGRIRYTSASDTWNYCDGANWLELGGDLWTDSGAGYIQYSSALGGIQVGNVPALSVPVPADTGAALIAIIEDRKPSGTSGGEFTNGTWLTRDLNTIAFNDSDGRVSLSANQFTLTPDGTETFLIYADAPAFDVQGHQARLRNITDTATVAPGTSQSTRAEVVNYSHIRTAVTISSPKTFEIQHYAQDNQDPGLGRAAGFGEQEIYTRVIIMRQ